MAWYTLAKDCSPVLVQKTYHTCAVLVFVVLFADLACLGDLPGVIFSADRIHSPKAGSLDCGPLLGEPLAAECVHCSVEVIVCDVLS